MIRGTNDTYFTIEEFASMIGRAPKTILNWASAGKIEFANLCGVKLVSMRVLEMLVAGTAPTGRSPERLALELMGRMTADGKREEPERRRRRDVRPRPTSAPEAAQTEDQSGAETPPCGR